jgi:hypothetical protein
MSQYLYLTLETDLSLRGKITNSAPASSIGALDELLVHGLSIISGQYRLYKFRSSYAHLQDTPIELLGGEVSSRSSEATVVIVLLSVCFLLRVARTQRMDSRAKDVAQFLSHGSHRKMLCNYLAGSLLVAIARASHLHGSGFMVSIAMLTMIEMWKDTMLEYQIVGTGLAESALKTQMPAMGSERTL